MRLFLFLGLFCVLRAASAFPVGQQAHSFNDVRQWKSLGAHGTTHLKIDLHWTEPALCTGQHWVSSPERGCFLLSHDTPVAGVQYPSAESVAALIARDGAALFAAAADEVQIATCFKAPHPCHGKGKQWVELGLERLRGLRTALDGLALPHGAVVIRDGASTSGGMPRRSCLLGTGYEDFVEVFVEPLRDPPEAAKSNDPSKGFDAFRVFNAEAVKHTVAHYASRGWEKFGQDARFPITVWEPAPQAKMLEFRDIFAAAKPANASLRYRLSSNVDPVLFANYVSDNGQLLRDPDVTSTTVPVVLDAGRVVVWNTSIAVGGQVFLSGSSLPFVPVAGVTLSSGRHALVGNDGSCAIAALKNDRLAPVESCHFAQAGETAWSASARASDGRFAVSFVNKQGRAVVAIVSADASARQIVAEMDPPADQDVVATTVALARNGSVAFFAASSSSLEILVADAVLDASQGGVQRATLSARGVGSMPSASFTQDSGSITLVHSRGHAFNHETANKDANVLVCDQIPVATDGVLVYTTGSVADFAAGTATGSPCTRGLVGGTLAVGHNARVFTSSTGTPMVVHGTYNAQRDSPPARVKDMGLPLERGNGLLVFAPAFPI